MANKYGQITKNILFGVAAVGIIAVAATSPYFLVAVAKEFTKRGKYKSRNGDVDNAHFTRSLAGLNKNKIIIIKKEQGNYIVKLTEKGKKLIKKIQFEDMRVETMEKWDGKWRIVIFDIPEGNKRRGKILRDAMRFKMQTMGFYQFQKSVWAHAYPCEKEIQLLCEILKIGQFVNIITAEKIFNDDALRRFFKF